jgi:proline iminopeptidase
MMNRTLQTVGTMASLLTLAACLDPDEAGNLVPETVAEDPLLPAIEVNGTRLHSEAFGDIHNPIVVFLHGGPGSDYRALISQKGQPNASRYPDERTVTGVGLSQLQDEYYCVFYDQRGAGLSPRFDSNDIDVDLYVDDLDAVIDYYLHRKKEETGVLDDQVTLFAWSYGGVLATTYINAYPERVRDVAFYEPGPIDPAMWDYLADNMTSVFGQLDKDWLDEYLLSHDHITPDTHSRFDYQMTLGAGRAFPEFHEDPNTPFWRIGAVVSTMGLDYGPSVDFDITQNLDAFEGGVLVMAGALTVGELPGYIDLLRPHYPGFQYVEIADVGHTGPWGKADDVAAEIRSFLSR